MTGPEPHSWVRDLDVYVGGKSRIAGMDRVIKLSSNESPFGPSPRALDAYQGAAATLHRYPDGTALALREAIGAAHGLDPARIICGFGSDEILKLACRAYAGPGDEVIYSRYGFMMYPIAARSVGATPVEAPDRDFVADVDAILEAVTARTRIVFLANPNNPTGTYLPVGDVERLARNLPEDVLLVLDAAYAEYVERSDYEAGEALVDAFPNVLMTRTFSKLYGLAALRLGWGYGTPAVIEVLNRMRDPFNVTTPAQAAGIAAVADQGFIEQARAHNTRWLERLTQSIRKLGLDVVPSVANFVLIRFPEKHGITAEGANNYLTRNGVLLRWLPNQGLGNCLRMTVGLDEENERVLALLGEFIRDRS
ncbi:MAG: histidinol-phosphate transaminase [Alphaproteobacteria bacterium]|nr:MAG: histidinol-phosphate transaminase [Alphaproteobacteria bacterium]